MLKINPPLYFLILLLIFVCTFSETRAQTLSTSNKKAIKLYEEAYALINQRKFEPATELLEAAVKKDPDFAEAHLELGSVYKLLLQHDKAKAHFKRASELKPDAKSMIGAYFVTGEYYFNDGDYEKAMLYFNKVLGYNPTMKGMLEKTKKYMENSAFALEALKQPMEFKPRLMPVEVNKFYLQAFPVVTADGQSLIFQMRQGTRPQDSEDIVISQHVNGKWTEPVSISKNINTPLNEGACSISGDGRTLVFTSCRRQDGLSESCDLYISYKEGNEWSIPVNMGPYVNTVYWESEPSISADGRTIYFTSDRRGGFGKEDIWYTVKNEQGMWTQARNIGATINTAGREVSPFLHANGKAFFFSSDFHPGMGGFDIFCSVLADSTAGIPQNIGYPVNTALNDISLFITADGSKGYYSVDQRENGSLHYTKAFLYEFDVPPSLHAIVKSNTYAKGKIYDAVTKTPLGASVDLIDVKTNKLVQSVGSDSKSGEYIIVLTEGNQYALYVSRKDYLFKSLSFDYRNAVNFNPNFLDIYLDPLSKGASVVLNNIFFASNSFQLDPSSKTELNKISLFLSQNPGLQIEFGGYTDNVGAEEGNLTLSQKRAKAVYDYLVTAGISNARLRFKGYGEAMPKASNETEEGRAVNRRIEFKIL